MQLPNIPTDNLYKFLSISGLWIFLVFMFIPHYFIHITLDKKRDLELSNTILNIELESLTTESIEIESAIEIVEKIDIKGDVDASGNLINIVSKLESRNIKVMESLKELQIARAKQKAELNESEYYIAKLAWFSSIQWYGTIFGGFMSLIGFISWYFIIQRIEDKLRAKQVEKKYIPREKSRFLSIRKIR